MLLYCRPSPEDLSMRMNFGIRLIAIVAILGPVSLTSCGSSLSSQHSVPDVVSRSWEGAGSRAVHGFPTLPTTHENVLYSFQGDPDGAFPATTLVSDANGALYGTTEEGGPSQYAYGTVFKLTPKGGGTYSESVIYDFQNGVDGSDPQSVSVDSFGNVYGTTYFGGGAASGCGCGTVFKLTPMDGGSYVYSLLHAFQGGNDSGFPQGALVVDSRGQCMALHRLPAFPVRARYFD
jgi:uncharacterized repeat protein (TIGR03803 family)